MVYLKVCEKVGIWYHQNLCLKFAKLYCIIEMFSTSFIRLRTNLRNNSYIAAMSLEILIKKN